jgi:hypothetical protein
MIADVTGILPPRLRARKTAAAFEDRRRLPTPSKGAQVDAV